MDIIRALMAAGLVIAAGAAPMQLANPWFGTWKLKVERPGMKPETLIYSDAGDGAMRMESVEDKSILVTRFDGKPAVDEGAGATPGNALAVTATSPTSYDWTFFAKGKPWVRGTNRLAADRRSFSETSWLVEKPAETITIVYERQAAD